MTLGKRLGRFSDIGLAGVLMLTTAMLILPLPSLLIDFFLIANVSFAVVILMVTIYVTDPLQLSVFPSLLLSATLVRLGLNVAMARLILSEGSAGGVVAAFGGLVVGGDVIVGLVIFAILLIIQFMVITNGASRMAEVAARFTLDALPGKQMAIDAELNAGTLTEERARERRRMVERQADFFGAMDGSSKFVRGDAIAGLLITVVNLLGGFGVGMIGRGLPAGDAFATYAMQAVGAGLAIQIPSLLVSAASGLILSRTSADAHLGADMLEQLLARWKPLAAGAVVVGAIGLFPGLPKLPFLLCAAALGGMAAIAHGPRQPEPVPEAPPAPTPSSPEAIQALAEVDPMGIEVGYGVIAVVEPSQGGDLLDRVVAIRRQFAASHGLILPQVRVRDDSRLGAREYRMTIRGVEIARGELMPTSLLAIRVAPDATPLPGIQTTDPAFGAPAVWIADSERGVALASGYEVVEPSVVIATHLAEVLRRHGWRLLTRQEVHLLLERVKERHKALVEELVPGLMSVGDVQKVLQALLRENVPIKDLVTVLETLADQGRVVKDIDRLVEATRLALGRGLYQHLVDEQQQLCVLTLDPAAERYILDAAQAGRPLDVEALKHLQEGARRAWESASAVAAHPVLLCGATVRPALWQLLESTLPRLAILAYEELDPAVGLHRLGVVTFHAGAPV